MSNQKQIRAIRSQWPKCEVKLLRWENDVLIIDDGSDKDHCRAQSMRGFYKYVYEDLPGQWSLNSGFNLGEGPVRVDDLLGTHFPIAFLLYEVKK